MRTFLAREKRRDDPPWMYSESLNLCDTPYPYAPYRLAGKAAETKWVCNPNPAENLSHKFQLTNCPGAILVGTEDGSVSDRQ